MKVTYPTKRQPLDSLVFVKSPSLFNFIEGLYKFLYPRLNVRRELCTVELGTIFTVSPVYDCDVHPTDQKLGKYQHHNKANNLYDTSIKLF